MTGKQNRFFRFLIILLVSAVIFESVNFVLSEIADRSAYEDAEKISQSEWETVINKDYFTESDYDLIFSQTGLGKSAADSLSKEEIEEYYDYYTEDKDFQCIREGVFACHEKVTDKDGKSTQNPPFADLQNGDIILTLSIHSLGWRHGHAAIVVDAENGITAEAVMIGEKSSLGSINAWEQYPLVAVLRAKDLSEDVRDEIADFTEKNMLGINYSLTAGVFSGRDTEKLPPTTQCAHFVWYVYKNYGIDLNSDDGLAVTPRDILESDKLEIVQIYGNI